MRIYLTTYGLYWVGGNVYPKGTLTGEIIGDNIVFSYADGKRSLEPVEISAIQREDGTFYGDINTFIDEVGDLFKPFIAEGGGRFLESIGVGRNTNGNSAISFNYPDAAPNPVLFYDNSEATPANAFKLDFLDGSTEYVLHSGNSAPLMAAEIATIMAIEDFTVRIDSPNVYGNGINRGEIEDALTEAGIVLPLKKNWKFFVKDANNKLWFITYFKDIDKFATEKMPLK